MRSDIEQNDDGTVRLFLKYDAVIVGDRKTAKAAHLPCKRVIPQARIMRILGKTTNDGVYLVFDPIRKTTE